MGEMMKKKLILDVDTGVDDSQVRTVIKAPPEGGPFLSFIDSGSSSRSC